MNFDYHGHVLRAVYESTPANVTELRRVVVHGVCRAAGSQVFNNEAMRATLREVPDFAIDLAMAHQAISDKYESIVDHRSRCGACGTTWAEAVQEVCACGILGPCDAPECQQRWIRESVCLNCFALEKLSYPKVPRSG